MWARYSFHGLSGSSSIIIDQLQASLRDQYLSTAEKVVIRQQDDGFVVEPATIRINDGSVQGSLLLKDGTDRSTTGHGQEVALHSVLKIQRLLWGHISNMTRLRFPRFINSRHKVIVSSNEKESDLFFDFLVIGIRFITKLVSILLTALSNQ